MQTVKNWPRDTDGKIVKAVWGAVALALAGAVGASMPTPGPWERLRLTAACLLAFIWGFVF